MTNFEKWKAELTVAEFPWATDGACGNCPVWKWNGGECFKAFSITEHPNREFCVEQKYKWAYSVADEEEE